MIEGLTAEQNARIKEARRFYEASSMTGLMLRNTPGETYQTLLDTSRRHLQKVMSIIDELAKSKEGVR